MTAPVIGQGQTEPVAVDTVVTGEWIITLNADREIYRDGAIAVTGGVITEVGKRAGLGIEVHPHMLRHSCGFALANKGRDTRLIQDYLGHRNIQHTQIYTRTAAVRFEDLWR